MRGREKIAKRALICAGLITAAAGVAKLFGLW
jgi:hypothetical protein